MHSLITFTYSLPLTLLQKHLTSGVNYSQISFVLLFCAIFLAVGHLCCVFMIAAPCHILEDSDL